MIEAITCGLVRSLACSLVRLGHPCCVLDTHPEAQMA
jgi:hypothetical protein